MDELINDFIAESREMLDALSGAIVAWEAEPGDKARLDEIFRFVHTVKGNCGFFDLPRIQRLSHAAEDALAEARAGRRGADPALVGAVLAVIDRLAELIEALASGEEPGSADDEALIAALDEPAEHEAAPNPAEAGQMAGADRKTARTIRLSVDLLDRMMSGVSDAVLARNELARRLREAPGNPDVEAAFERVSACIAEIRGAITRTRMQRIDSLFSALPRLVRDLSAELGKEVRLELDGGDVELDREMIEMIRDPMTHIVRNAIDHGIETPEERRRARKPAAGRLEISARQSGNQILIEVADDGRGIDGQALVGKAIAAGIIAAEEAGRMSRQRRTALIFEPGLSTAGAVTAISGRGVGMDVVRANIERIGGLVEVDSEAGQGVRLTIRVPLTLTIIPALTVSAGGQVFALPRSAIEEILRAGGGAVGVEQVGEARIATVRGRRVPLVSLPSLLGREAAAAPEAQRIVLLKPAGGDAFALAVDSVHDHEELVVKPAAPAVMAAGLYAGTTIADDGMPVLLLDPSGIAARAELSAGSREEPREEPAPAEERAQSRLLLVTGLDGAPRAIALAAVERIEDVPAEAIRFGAGKLRVATGGRILPLAGCKQAPSEGKLRILRLTDGGSEIAYGFAEVRDIVSAHVELRPAAAPGETAGVALIEGEQVELIDPYWLFAAHADQQASAPMVCALPAGDPWMENMLRPMIEGLGYRVVEAGEGVKADLLIVSAESGEAPAGPAGRVLRIRSTPHGGDNDNSIYRYDRAALLGALSRSALGENGNG